jgi:gliding motility-associated-like protein
MMKKLYIYIFLIFSSFALAQSSTCENAAAMCSGNQGPFNNTTGVPSFGSLGCLGSTPNPAWFYLQVGTSGNIDMTLFQTSTATGNGIDVDFILWGPFNSLSNICNNLALYSPGYTGPNNVVDCSYSASATEQVNISGAVAGQYYMLLVTNFSNQAGTYTLNQTGGSGALSCSIVCGVTLGPDLPFCGSTTSTTLTANFLQAPTAAGSPVYSWFLNGVFQYTTTTNTTVVNQSGTWSVSVTRPGCSDVATDDVEVQFSVAVPSNPVGPLVGPSGECNPVFDLNDILAALVAPYDPSSFTFVFVDENFDEITDLANFSPTASTIIGVVPSLGSCEGDFQMIDVIVDCVVPACQLELTSATDTTDQTICIGESIVDITYTFGGDATDVTVVDLPTGVTATVVSGVLTISGTPSTTTGSFTYTVSTVDCSPELTLQGTITIADAPTFTSLSAITPICEGEDAVFTLEGSAGATVEYTINGGAIQTETFNASGEVIITIPAVTADTTIEVSEIAIGSCIVALNETITVVVSVIPDVPTIDVTAPTCVLAGFATITNYDAALTYTFTPAGPTITATGLIENMVVGTNYTVTAGNTTCTSADSAAFSNAAQLITPAVPTIAITAPTCLAAGFATITNYVVGMTYDFTPVGPTVDGTGLISGMIFGTSYEVAANNGSCSSVNTAPFSIEDILVTPAVPTVATTAPTCTADGFTEITNYDATLTYTFTPAGPTITAAGLIENVVFGTSYVVNADNGNCTSADSTPFTVQDILAVPDVPTITITAPTCLAAGFATITNYVAGMSYDFTPAGPIVDGTGLISGMTFGTSYEVAANNGSCSSVNTAPFSIEDILVTPTVPTVATTAPTCTADGFTEITNYDAALTYTFTPAGPTITATGLIENMVVGTNYTVTAGNATCTSADSAAFSNAAQLITPAVPTIAITAPTCLAAGFATITNYVAGMSYDFTPAGPIVDGTGLISGMTFGTSYEVAANNGSCSSVNTAPFSIEDILVTPTVPTVATTAPTCTADGFTEITNYDAALTYTFTPAGPTITATGLIENMVVGTSYTVTAGNTTCTSADSAAFSNAAQLVTPDVPTIAITAPTCSAAGFATITNYVVGMTYDFTPAGPTVDGTGLISGMIFGTSYEVAANNGSCSSVNTAPFSIEDILVTPTVPTVATTAPTCTADGFTEITNYDAALTYTFTPAGPTITATGLIENMVVGTNYTVTAGNTTCTSADSAAFSNAAQLITPAVPTIAITAPTCLAAGFATITNYVVGMTYDFTPVGPTVDGTGLISGMTFGTSYEVAANNGSCSSVNAAPFSIEDILVTPTVPTVALTAPTCTADGFTEITNYDATLAYTFTPAGPTITATGLIENMVVGTNYTVTAGNATCTSADSAAFSNAAQLVTPDVPTIAITAPTCLAAGFATITNYVVGMTYDFTPAGPTVDGTGLISGMTFGTSYEVAANNGSCSSVNTAPFSIEDILVTPTVPMVATTAPTCTADGFTEITNYDAALTYTFTPAGPTITATGLIENMVVGTSYTVTAGNTTCTSADSAAFSNAAQLVTPDVPTIAITAPTCSSNGVSTITNYNGTLTYTFSPVGPTVGAGGLISGMTVGTSYTVTAGNGSCTSAASISFSNAAQLPAPVVTSVTNNGPVCEGANVVFTIIGTPNAVVSYSGVVGVPANTVTLNASGQATVTVAGATSNQTITLNTVTNPSTGCSATINNTSTATILPLPTANLSSANPATCSGGSVVLNFTGTPNAIVSFTDGTNNYNVTLDGTGVNNYTTLPISSTTTFTLTSVATTGTPSCSQTVGDSVTVVITPRPIMTASPNPLVLCNGATMNLVLNSDVAGTTYTWSASTTNIEGSFALSGTGADINQVVQLQDPMAIGYVTIVVIPRANNCDGDPLTIQVIVNPIPEISAVNVSAETICSNNEVAISVVGVPSGLSYTWQAVNVNGVTIVGGVTSGTSTTGNINVTLVTTDPLVAGTIQFEITPIRNGCTGDSVLSPVITVNPIPGTPIGLPETTICSGDNANLNISVTPLMAGTQLDWVVVEAVNITEGFATEGSGESPILINDILINVTNQPGFVRYRVTTRLNDCIGNTTDFIVRVNPEPRPTLQDGAICVDGSGVTFQTYVLNSGLSGTMYDFDWYYNGTLIAGATGNTYTATQPGTYSLIVTNTLTGCFSEEVFANVIEVQPATAITYTVTDAFSNNATITVNVTGGSGTLLYQLDDEGFQESSVFTGVAAGPHTVTVIDTQGCTYLTINVFVIDYPPFFTPNGDGFNDTWNITGLKDQPESKIYIFDRYGKLLKQISPSGLGWDGRFNGADLPSTDYWFTVEYLENEQSKVFKAHFSLIR